MKGLEGWAKVAISHRLAQMKGSQISTDTEEKNLCSSVSSNLCPSVLKSFNSPTEKVEVKSKGRFEILRRENSFEQDSGYNKEVA